MTMRMKPGADSIRLSVCPHIDGHFAGGHAVTILCLVRGVHKTRWVGYLLEKKITWTATAQMTATINK